MLLQLEKNKKGIIFIQFIFLFSLILFSIIFLYYYKYNNISNEYRLLLDRVTNEHKIILDNEFNDIRSDIEYLSSGYILTLLKDKDHKLKERVQSNFYNYIMSKDKYDQIRIIDKTGQEIIRIDKKGTFPVIIPSEKLQNKKDRYYFKDALKLRPDDIYISQLDLNKEHAEIELPIKPMIRLVKPIFDNKFQIDGMIIFNYKAKKIINKLQQSASNHNLEMSMFNKQGNILQFSDDFYNWSFMYEDRKIKFLKELDEPLWNDITQYEDGFFENKYGIFYVKPYFPYSLLLNESNNILSDNNKKWQIVLSKQKQEISQLALNQVLELIPFAIFFLLFGMLGIWKLTEYRYSLKKEEEKTRIALITFSNTAQAIMISDGKNNVIQVNKAFTDITGYESKELVGKNPKFLKSGKTKKIIYTRLWRSLLKQNVWEGVLWNRKKDGTVYPSLLKINVFRDGHKRVKNYIAVFSDITEQMNIQKNLEAKNLEISQSKEQIELAMNDLKSAQSQIIQSEKMAALGQLIAGVAHEINTPLGAINSSSTNIENALDNILENTLKLSAELPKNLKETFIEVITTDLNFTNAMDFTNQRTIKKELIIQLKEQEIDNSRRIADIIVTSNLVNKMDKLIPLLKSEYSKEIMDSISKINSIIVNTANIGLAVSRASRIVKALKNFSHQTITEEMVYAKISDGIETVLTIYYSQIKREITIEKEYGEVGSILCHFDELNQVWTNIIQNGLQAMNYKGKMTIQILEDENYQIVQISDNGIGMSEEVKEKIFEPFYTTKAIGEGTGLGLDIVKKIIDKHNGKIEVETKLGEGTTFRIYINKNLKEQHE